MTSTTRITLTCAVALLVSTCCCRSKLFGDEDEQEEDFAELFSSSSKSVKTEGASGPFTGQKVKMEFYLMSKCPYGTKVQLAMVDVLEDMGPYVEYRQDFIASEKDGKINCMHGEDECKGNIAQLCAAEHFPDTYFPMSACMARDMRGVPDNWESCAKEADLDTGTIATCMAGTEGEQLLRTSLGNARARNARGSPTMYIGGMLYTGARSAEGFEEAICAALPQSDRPASCPEIKSIRMTVITDSRCGDCPAIVEKTNGRMKSLFTGLQIVTLDWSDPEARTIAGEAGVEILPAFVFDEDVTESPGFEGISKHVSSSGGYRLLDPKAVRATFNPLSEICDNGADDTGNGLVDCEDPGCAEALPCREEMPGRLDLFLMSKCPHSATVMAAMPAVLESHGKRIDLHLHYLTSILDEAGYATYPKKDVCYKNEDGRWLCSLHGPEETKENVRQLCVQELYSKKNLYLDYVTCRYGSFSADWKSCVSPKMSADQIEECATGETGMKLLEANYAMHKALGVTASPTFMWNNKTLEQPKPYTADAISSTFCTHNPGKGCK